MIREYVQKHVHNPHIAYVSAVAASAPPPQLALAALYCCQAARYTLALFIRHSRDTHTYAGKPLASQSEGSEPASQRGRESRPVRQLQHS